MKRPQKTSIALTAFITALFFILGSVLGSKLGAFLGDRIVSERSVKTVTLYSPYGCEQWSYTGDFDITYGENTVIRYIDTDGTRHTVNALGTVCEISESRA